MSRTLRELREEMTEEMVKNVLEQYNVLPFDETDAFIIFPTCCRSGPEAFLVSLLSDITYHIYNLSIVLQLKKGSRIY